MNQEYLHIKTPTWFSEPLSRVTGKNIYLKMECFQPTGSFKARGICWLVQKFVGEGKTHIVAASGGNAGYTAAYAAKKLGIKATVFVPKMTLKIFSEAIASQGATIIEEGETFSESAIAAHAFAKEKNAGYVSPFNHPVIWEGHATMIDEVVSDLKEAPEGVVAAVGGGGMLTGILQGLYKNGWTQPKAYAVETEGAACFAKSVKANKIVELETIDTIARSLGSKKICEALFNWSKKHPITPIVVSDKEAIEATKRFLNDHRILVEPSCGAALAAVYRKDSSLKDCRSILLIICGGIGISWDLLNNFLRGETCLSTTGVALKG